MLLAGLIRKKNADSIVQMTHRNRSDTVVVHLPNKNPQVPHNPRADMPLASHGAPSPATLNLDRREFAYLRWECG